MNVFGFSPFDGHNSRRLLLAVVLVLGVANACVGKNLLLITRDSSYTFQEQQRVTQFESWGYTVTPLEDSQPQSAYDAALANADVVYVSEDVGSGSVSHKLRETTVGVVNEEAFLDTQFGFSSSNSDEGNQTNLSIIDNTHFITAATTSATITVLTPAGPVSSLQGTLAPGLRVLGQWGPHAGLAVLETGDQLANTFNGSDTAFGRRVAFPLDDFFDFDDLTSDGLELIRRAILWAATVPTASEDLLLVLRDPVLTVQERMRVAQFESWGYTVTTIQDGDSQANFDAAASLVDVVYVSEEAASGDVSYKLREASVGVFLEDAFLGSEFGFASSVSSEFSQSSLTITNNSHPITSPLSLGTLPLTSPANEVISIQGTLAPGLDILGQWSNGTDALVAIEIGGELYNTHNGNSTAAGRRAWLPVANSFDWGDLTLDGVELMRRSLVWLVSLPPGSAGELLFVSSGFSADAAGEQLRIDQFERWGYTVTTIVDSDSDASFEAALALTDVVYVSQAVSATSLAHKLRTTQIGVVHEGVEFFDDNVGWTTATGQNTNTCTTMTVVDNTHPISEHFSTGTVSIFDSSANAFGSQVVGTLASGAQTLATNECVSSGNASVLTLEAGATLANTFDGNSTASGRRVRLPYGGFSSFDWPNLSAGGRILIRRALQWATAGTSGPIAHWRLDETSGTVAADSSGNGNDGTYVNSPNPVLAQYGHGLQVVAGDRIDAGNFAASGSAISLSAWFYVDTFTDYGRILVRSSSNGADDQSWALNVHFGGDLRFRLNAGGSSDTFGVPGVLQQGCWHHAVATYNGSEVKLYLDNQLVLSDSHSVGGVIQDDSSHTVTIGDSVIGGRPFEGIVDDVRVYHRVLSQSDVAELYGLLGHWAFDEGTGSEISDSSLQGHDASFNVGTPIWISGVRGNALEFDGASDAITDSEFDPPAIGSVSFWMRSDGLPVSSQRLFGTSDTFEAYQDTDGILYLNTSVSGGPESFNSQQPLETVGRWYHIVANYNSETDEIETYVDGLLVQSGVYPLDLTDQPANFLSFGARTGSLQRFSGGLDDLRIYNRWLTAKEIAQQYGLVGHWRLDEQSGFIAHDSTPFENHGSLFGSSAWSQVGGVRALELDGTSGYVDLGNPPHLNFEGPITLSAWVRIHNHNQNLQYFIAHGHQFSPAQREVRLRYFSQDYDIGSWAPPELAKVAAPSSDQNSWVNIIGTYDGADWRLYRNGVLENTTPGPNGAVRVDNVNWAIGARGTGSERFLDGDIRDVRIYNRAITDSEVADVFTQGDFNGIRIMRWVEVR